ncbi:hypothetical protein W97_00011 [Coniosporium apollinis CBS 100218]|uniref:CBM-cenC domain-containing protein n=1 Tax=Coniosporium apollinis (strain CBS 100218) TaxID=1168221 RepID=R7YFX1_CONA1|nr:uncharacterized protein W97_00011 [Coniosporium apollinis CBS 100218]EON60802.1 hypothetical protein W97_00011 [Coniosporium apollinis CBS 100218]
MVVLLQSLPISFFALLVLDVLGIQAAPQAAALGTCNSGLARAAAQALVAPAWSSRAYEFCSTYISVPRATKIVATTRPAVTDTTVYVTSTIATITVPTTVVGGTTTTTVSTITPLATTTKTTTVTEAVAQAPTKRDVQIEERQGRTSLLPIVSNFAASVVSSACSCVKNRIPIKTSSVTATSPTRVTATSTASGTATEPLTVTIQEVSSEIATAPTSTVTVLETTTVAASPSCTKMLFNGDFEHGDFDFGELIPLRGDAGLPECEIKNRDSLSLGPNPPSTSFGWLHCRWTHASEVQLQQTLDLCVNDKYHIEFTSAWNSDASNAYGSISVWLAGRIVYRTPAVTDFSPSTYKTSRTAAFTATSDKMDMQIIFNSASGVTGFNLDDVRVVKEPAP